MVMVLLADRSWDKLAVRWKWGPDREKHIIQSLKLMLAFAWNSHVLQVVDAMSYHVMSCHVMSCHVMSCHAKMRDVHGRLSYPKYSHWDRCSAWREVKGYWSCIRTMQGHIQQKWESVLWWQFLANCKTSTFILIAGPGSLWLSLVWTSHKSSPRTAIRVCRWTSFGSPKIMDEISDDILEVVFREWIKRLDSTDTLQQMESRWNEATNNLLSYSWQRWDLEMLIPLWDTQYCHREMKSVDLLIYPETSQLFMFSKDILDSNRPENRIEQYHCNGTSFVIESMRLKASFHFCKQ
jgi:hypothetical protein